MQTNNCDFVLSTRQREIKRKGANQADENVRRSDGDDDHDADSLESEHEILLQQERQSKVDQVHVERLPGDQRWRKYDRKRERKRRTKRLTMRPMGVVSKNDIGTRINERCNKFNE